MKSVKMTPRARIATAICLALAIVVSASMLAPTLKSRFFAKQNMFEAVADSGTCSAPASKMILSGSVENGEALLAKCTAAGDEQASELLDYERRARIAYENLLTRWTPRWPAYSTDPPLPLPDSTADEIITAADSLISTWPHSYHARLTIFYKGLLLYSAGRYSACVRWFNENRHTTTLPAHAIYIKARASIRNGHFRYAASEIETLERRYPDNPVTTAAKLLKCDVALANGGEAEAIATARAVMADTNASPAARGGAAAYAIDLLARSDNRSQIPDIVTSAALSYPALTMPSPLDTYIDFDRDSFTPGQRAALARHFRDTSRGYAIIRILKPIAKTAGPEVSAFIAAGYFMTGDFKTASTLTSAITAASVPETIRADACLTNARSSLKLHNWDGAQKKLAGCADKYPSIAPDALESLAYVQSVKGDEANRLATLRRLLAIAPRNPSAPDWLATIARHHLRSGSIANATPFYNSIITDFPDSMAIPESLFWTAIAKMSSGDTPSAISRMTKLRVEYPYSYYSFRAAARLSAIGADTHGSPDRLPDLCLKQLYPATDDSHIASANALRLLGMFAEANAVLDSAPATPSLPAAEIRSRILLAQGNIIASVKAIELEILANPSSLCPTLSLQSTSALLFPRYYSDLTAEAAANYSLDPAWPLAVIRQESRFKADATSRSDARGLMQIIPSTGCWLAGKFSMKCEGLDLYEPSINVSFGTWYLAYLLSKFKNEYPLAIGAYNGGPGNMTRWLASYPVSDRDVFVELVPRDETRDYIKKVLANYYIYKSLP